MGKRKLNLYIVHGDEYRSRVGSIYEEDTFFRESYLQAGKCVKEIIEASRRFEERTARSQYAGDGSREPSWFNNELALSLHSELASYPNNIIAFCGHRGQGKTSAMVSFSKALEKLHLMQKPQVKSFWAECVGQKTDWEKWEFIVVDPVDPTSMEQTDSILRILLSRLFIKVRKAYEDRKGTTWRQDQLDQLMNRVMGDFRDCYKILDTLKEKRQNDYYYDDLSSLVDLGDSSCMKQKMNQLVEDCCEFLSPTKERRKMLVLQLDDTDLNAQHAYEILEDIRKYLVIPGVIVLMATEMTQLSLIVEQHFVREFKEVISYSERQLDPQDTLNRMNCHNSAENYIGKLFPSMHQIHLPALDEVICGAYSELFLHYLDENQQDLLASGRADKDSEYQKVLISRIYEKTRIVLLEPKSYLHNLLPSSMRQLTHFLTVLKEMPDLDPAMSLHKIIHSSDSTAREQKGKLLHNLDLLSGYFRHVWCPIHLTTLENMEMQKIFTASSSSLHQQVMLSLKKIGGKAQPDSDSGKRYLYSDVLEQLYTLRQCEDRERFYKICFAVQFYYTLYNYQNLITEKVKLVNLQAASTKKAKQKNFFLSWQAKKIQELLNADSQPKPDMYNFLLMGCLARVKGQEGSVETFQMDRIAKYETIQFDPQYLLFPSRVTELRAGAVMADGGEAVERHDKQPSAEGTESTAQSDKAETTPKYQSQPDASLIYWATPSLQHLFAKATSVACGHTMSSSQPEFEKYSEALSRAVKDFKERLEGKTKELQLATGFPIHEGGEMRNAFQTLYEIEEKKDSNQSGRKRRQTRR